MTKTEKLHRKQLVKAAELSRINLDELSPIDLQRLRLDLYEFHIIVGMGTHYAQTETDDPGAGVPERYVQPMLEGLRDAFKEITQAAPQTVLHIKPRGDVEFTVVLDPSITPSVHTNLELGRDSAFWALFKHFEKSGLILERVRFCPREECRNIFVLGSHARADRMRYCSVKCSRLAAIRAYREREEEKKARKLKAQKRGGGKSRKRYQRAQRERTKSHGER